jgi:hypothetical protein
MSRMRGRSCTEVRTVAPTRRKPARGNIDPCPPGPPLRASVSDWLQFDLLNLGCDILAIEEEPHDGLKVRSATIY